MTELKTFDCCFAVSEGRSYAIEAESKEQAEIIANNLYDHGELREPDKVFVVDFYLNDVDKREVD
jgi:hypothetical protein